MAVQPQRDIRLFGGISESDYIGREWDFSVAYDINNQRDIAAIQLENKLNLYSTVILANGHVTSFVEDGADTWFFTDQWGANSNGASYKNGTNVPGADASGTGNSNIRTGIKFGNDTILLIRTNKIDSLNTTTDTTANVAALDYTADWSLRPAIVFSGNMIYGNGKYLQMVDSALLTNTVKLTFETWEEIVYISGYLDQVKVYTRKNGDTIQYVWDGISDTRAYSSTIEGMSIAAGTTVWGIDYIRLWLQNWSGSDEQVMFQFSGTQYQEVFRNNNGNYDIRQAVYGNDITSAVGNMFFIAGDFEDASTGLSGKSGVFKHFYTKATGKLDILGIWPQLWFETNVDCVYANEDFLYICYDNSPTVVYRMSLDNGGTPNKAAIGSLETLKLWYDNIFKKKIKEIRVLSKNMSASNNIKIYYRIDDGAYTLLDTITADWLKEIYANNMPTTLPDFNTIQFKIELNTNWSSQTTPNLLRLVVFYDILER